MADAAGTDVVAAATLRMTAVSVAVEVDKRAAEESRAERMRNAEEFQSRKNEEWETDNERWSH